MYYRSPSDRIDQALNCGRFGKKEEPKTKQSKYRYVYENWYVKSCEKSNETPVSFDVYFNIMPYYEIMQLNKMLEEGIKP